MKMSELKIQDNWLVYVSRGLSEAQSVGDSYKKWKVNMLAEIKKGTYADRIDVLINNKMPLIDLKSAKDEFEGETESDPNEW